MKQFSQVQSDFFIQVIVPKGKNEPLGIVIVESGWGSMLPTVVIANMMPGGPSARFVVSNVGLDSNLNKVPVDESGYVLDSNPS